jgi:hypothetical protein
MSIRGLGNRSPPNPRSAGVLAGNGTARNPSGAGPPRSAKSSLVRPQSLFTRSPGFDRHQDRRATTSHFTPQPRQLPVQNLSRRSCLIAEVQLLCRPQFLYQFANRLFSIRNDSQPAYFSVGTTTATAIVSAWTSNPKNRTFSWNRFLSACGSRL